MTRQEAIEVQARLILGEAVLPADEHESLRLIREDLTITGNEIARAMVARLDALTHTAMRAMDMVDLSLRCKRLN